MNQNVRQQLFCKTYSQSAFKRIRVIRVEVLALHQLPAVSKNLPDVFVVL
jgi:hypothetical protein